MYRILKNAILLGLIIVLSAWGWTLYQQRSEPEQEVLPLLELDKAKAKESVAESDTTEKEPDNPPELNLNIIQSLSNEKTDTSSEQGPPLDTSTSSVPGSSSSSTSINELLPEKSVPKKYFKYGYEGQEEDRHKLNLGVQNDKLNVKLGVEADKDRNTNINSVDIEVKLPD
uniref:Uncharacterized protein n=1 Tax=Hydrogenovibrio crunogenus (strain DSM 25203 / XCL-2) TaxID=317025 RepID=Q31H39_HYDCU